VRVQAIGEQMNATAKRLFVSYSRADSRSVHAVVKLLRATGAPIFLDLDSIPLGSQWRNSIRDAIAKSDAIMVFWSAAAADSVEVAAEYDAGMRLGKDIIPVVMDGTPLSVALAKYQSADLSELFCAHDVSYNPDAVIQGVLERIFQTPIGP
jgi:hypothetical protein